MGCGLSGGKVEGFGGAFEHGDDVGVVTIRTQKCLHILSIKEKKSYAGKEAEAGKGMEVTCLTTTERRVNSVNSH